MGGINDATPSDWNRVRQQHTAIEKTGLEPWTKLAEEEADYINSPPHYNTAGIECIDAMSAMVEQADVAPHNAYCWQNAFKYLWRWPYKNGLQDLYKARFYIDRMISELEEEQDGL